jgi:glyoxylase-like metal-dependent hydrolase (beta-lactamase superfamily II)
MKLDVLQLTLGPMGNNVYILGDHVSKDAVVIDPSYGADVVMAKVEERGWRLRQIWLTHAHFDHIAGADQIARSFEPPLLIGLHPDDEHWYRHEGGAGQFGMSISQPPPTSIHFEHGMGLTLGGDHEELVVEVHHAPGHSPGHVMFYCDPLGILFCGDVIFREGIGRTDLPGGDYASLMRTIRDEVLSLPDETRLLPGHGQETRVGYEREHNPFLQ